MGSLSERKIEIVRHLVETAPDRVVGGLQVALAEAGADSALGGVKLLVESEFADRSLRNTVFQPVAPLCTAGGDPARVTFPSRALALIWRALKEVRCDEIERLREDKFKEPHKRIDLQDQMLATALAGIREATHPDFVAAGDAAESAQPGGRDRLAACLEIGSVVRRATTRLPEWIAHAGGETTAAARLAYKDAVTIADDAGPLFFHMLSAQLAQPWMIMRIISAVMDKPTERYMRDSEVASFAEQLMADIDGAIAAISGMKTDDGPPVGRQAAALVELAVHQIMEMEGSVELPRDQGWGQRIVKQRAGLAGQIESRLKEAERTAIESMPMFAPRNQKVRHQIPQLAEPPDQRLVTRAMTLLTFSHELRSSSNYGGFSGARNKMVEKLGDYLDHYVESVVDLIRTDEVEDRAIAAAFLENAAEYNMLIRGEKAADIVRRRAAAAIQPEPPALAS